MRTTGFTSSLKYLIVITILSFHNDAICNVFHTILTSFAHFPLLIAG